MTRNEADRYLKDCLLWHFWMFDGIAVYDDQSSDATVSIANEYGAKTKVRADNEPSFLEHEAQFRQNAWRWAYEALNPTLKDWVMVIDADEFLMCGSVELFDAAITARSQNKCAVSFVVQEAWKLADDGVPLIRTDGYWSHESSVRFCQWIPNWDFPDKKMASGSLPNFARHNPMQTELAILHYGYVRDEDKQAKYERYKTLSGHNPTHIRSILGTPKLERWEKKVPILR